MRKWFDVCTHFMPNSCSDCKSKTPGFVVKTQSNKKTALWRFSKANIKGARRKVSELDANSCHMYYVLVKKQGVRDKHHHIGEKRDQYRQTQGCMFVLHMRVGYACSECRYQRIDFLEKTASFH